MGYDGNLKWDASKPDGQPRRILDCSLAQKNFGFVSKTKIEDGLKKTIKWYQQISH
jgi:GDP-L-fucose synthase